jgi:hypothetical protein
MLTAPRAWFWRLTVPNQALLSHWGRLSSLHGLPIGFPLIMEVSRKRSLPPLFFASRYLPVNV